jgi:hypothetical protein
LAYGKAGIPYLNRLDLNIKGDPYWIGRRNYVGNLASNTPVSLIDETGKSRRWLPEMSTDRSDKSAAPYDAGSVFIAFRYLFPKEYSHYQDDPTLHTGEVERSNMDLTYSGYYMVVKAEHNFTQGKFTTNLMTVKMNTNPNEVVFSDGTTVDTNPSQGGGGGASEADSNEGDDGSTDQALLYQQTVNARFDVTQGEATIGLSPEDQVNADRQAYLDGLSTKPVFDPNNPPDFNYLDPDFDYRQAYLLNNNGGG